MNSNDEKDSIKSHKQIIHMIDELKEFENIKIDHEIKEKPMTNEILEIDKNEINDNLVIETEEEKKEFLKNVNLFPKIRWKNEENKEINPSTFKIGFNKNGDLVNLDFKQKKIQEEKKVKLNFKNLFSLFKIKDKNKNEGKEKSNDSKISMIKDKIGKIGKLKKLIPSKGKKEKKAEEGSEQ